MEKALAEYDYMALFDDGTIGFTDGVGYLGMMDQDEVKDLYEKLKRYFEQVEKETQC